LTSQRVFDLPHYQALDRAKIAFLRNILPEWKTQFQLATSLDVACGVGHYSALLQECGFDVAAVEGRADNVEEAQRRVPGLSVHLGDVEELSNLGLGTYDLVFCLGLLYHLENPLRSIRQLCGVTGKLMVVESMCLEDDQPRLELRDEGPSEDQGLRHVAFYPSEPCLIKMMYRAGFQSVYRMRSLPDHPDFQSTRMRRRRRTMLVASRQELSSPWLVLAKEPDNIPDPWETSYGQRWRRLQYLRGFMVKPWPEKAATLRRLLGLGVSPRVAGR
jgi:SAM-dependent methyltransferase